MRYLLALLLLAPVTANASTECEPARIRSGQMGERCRAGDPSGCQEHAKALEAYRQCEADIARAKRQQDERDSETSRQRLLEDQRKQDEAAVAERNRIEQEHQDKIRAIKNSPEKIGVLVGADLCYARQVRMSALNEIEKEKKYARLGGVINKDKIYQLQSRVRWADESIAANTGRLRSPAWQRAHILAAPCSQPTVAAIVGCKSDKSPCNDELALYSEIMSTPPDTN